MVGAAGDAREGDGRLRVSVVVPTYNRRGSLAQVLRPLLADPSTDEVVLVVDGCDDGSFELLSDWSRSEPRIRPLYQANAGEGPARQKGVEAARNEVVLLIDDDVIASAGLVSGHAEHHLSGAPHLVVGYMPTRVPESRRGGHVPTVLYADDYERTCRLYEADTNLILSNLWAGNMSMRREDALKVGLRTRGPLLYHADMQFGLRCREMGIGAMFDRSLLAWHSHSRSLRRFALECRRSGEARAVLLRDYPAMAEEIDPFKDLSPFQKAVAIILGAKNVRPVAAPVAMGVAYIAGRAGISSLEVVAARVLRQIEVGFGLEKQRGTVAQQ